MSSSASGATDPNGWLPPGTQPGSVVVKIANTSRESLNGKLAVVLAYMDDKGRYMVHTTKEQQQLLLKPENLLVASWMEQMTAQYETIQNNPEIQGKIREYYNLVQQKTGIKPEYVAGGGLIALLAFFYFVGFLKATMILSFVILFGTVIAPDIGSPIRVIARNLPMRVRNVIREQIPYVGPRIADNQYLSMAVTGLVLFFFVNAIVRSPPSRSTPTTTPEQSWSSSTRSHPHLATKAVPDRAMLEDYYRKGFEDGKTGHDFGTSLPVPVVTEDTMADSSSSSSSSIDDFEDFDFVDNSGVPPRQTRNNKKSTLDWSTIMSLIVVGQSVFSLGRTAEGRWDLQLALANARTMQPWRMGFLAFSLYRLGSSLFRNFLT